MGHVLVGQSPIHLLKSISYQMGEILLLQSSVRLNILIMTGSLFGCDYCGTANMNSLKKGEKYTSINDLRKKFGQKKNILVFPKQF